MEKTNKYVSTVMQFAAETMIAPLLMVFVSYVFNWISNKNLDSVEDVIGEYYVHFTLVRVILVFPIYMLMTRFFEENVQSKADFWYRQMFLCILVNGALILLTPFYAVVNGLLAIISIFFAGLVGIKVSSMLLDNVEVDNENE